LSFLAEASKQLSASLDYETTLARVAQLAVPYLADLCFVDLIDEDGNVSRVEVSCADPARAALADELRKYPPLRDGSGGVSSAIARGETELIPRITREIRRRATRGPEHFRVAAELGIRSVMRVPMRARGYTLGALTFCSAWSGRRYGQAELALAEDLTGRCAQAVDNALLLLESRQAVRSRDDFLAFASHDLKNPLTAIKAYAQALIRRAEAIEGPDGVWLADRLRQIDATASRMASQIDELLDVSRLRMGQTLSLERHPTDLLTVVRSVAADYRQMYEGRTVREETDLDELYGDWDSLRLERVISNLLSNALKYSPRDSEVVIRISRDEPRDEAVLQVIDRGLGIPKADLPHIFEQFHRGANVQRRAPGSGLGLAGVRVIVEQHGGSVEIDSVEGRGTTVTIRLPLAWSED
jgi:signal transduction histidine kinase